MDVFLKISLVKKYLVTTKQFQQKHWRQLSDSILTCKNQWFALTVAQYFSDLSSKAGVKLNQEFTPAT